MERHGDQVEVNEEEVSAGQKRHIVRYVLGISMFLVIVAFAIIWMSESPGFS